MIRRDLIAHENSPSCHREGKILLTVRGFLEQMVQDQCPSLGQVWFHEEFSGLQLSRDAGNRWEIRRSSLQPEQIQRNHHLAAFFSLSTSPVPGQLPKLPTIKFEFHRHSELKIQSSEKRQENQDLKKSVYVNLPLEIDERECAACYVTQGVYTCRT